MAAVDLRHSHKQRHLGSASSGPPPKQHTPWILKVLPLAFSGGGKGCAASLNSQACGLLIRQGVVLSDVVEGGYLQRGTMGANKVCSSLGGALERLP